jgi:hypothetical protein
VRGQRENEEKTERVNVMESQMDALLKAKDEVDTALEEAVNVQAQLQQTIGARCCFHYVTRLGEKRGVSVDKPRTLYTGAFRLHGYWRIMVDHP